VLRVRPESAIHIARFPQPFSAGAKQAPSHRAFGKQSCVTEIAMDHYGRFVSGFMLIQLTVSSPVTPLDLRPKSAALIRDQVVLDLWDSINRGQMWNLTHTARSNSF